MTYTVKQIAELAGVSTRTLHYYDEIGLLPASSYGANGYRYYDEQALLRLQQILFFRELDFSLADIQAIMGAADFDLADALQTHRRALQQRLARLSHLIQTIDRTMLHLKGAHAMQPKQLFEGFDEAQQAQYEEEAAQKYDPATVRESRRRWDSYSTEQRQQIGLEGEAVYTDLLEHLGSDPASPEVRAIIARWHQHMRYFYEPTPAIMLGLAQGYAEDPRFRAFYERLHPALPDYLRAAIEAYVAHLTAQG